MSELKVSIDLTIQDGDIITLKTDDGTFVKRYDQLMGHTALICSDQYSYFRVNIVDGNKIQLIADNGMYCKRFDSWKGMNFISMDFVTPDPYSDFIVTPTENGNITLQASDNKEYLRRYNDPDLKKSIIVAHKITEDILKFSVVKVGISCKKGMKISGFGGWPIHFDEKGNPTDFAIEAVRERFGSSLERTQHLFVFVHGVGTSFGSYEKYIEWFNRLYEVYQLNETGVSREDITLLGVNWKSQSMAEMLGSLSDQEHLPAKLLAENGLKDLVNEVTKGFPSGHVRVHLVGHSMGAQVLLYLLPNLQNHVEIGSMMFLQGFAPSSAFGQKPAVKPSKIIRAIKADVVDKVFNFHPSVDFDVDLPKLVKIGDISIGPQRLLSFHKSFDLNEEVWKQVSPWLPNHFANLFKCTYAGDQSLTYAPAVEFHKHLSKVKGPIVATTTGTLWADYQVGLAEAVIYSAPGVLGSRGFEEEDANSSAVHDLDNDVIEAGGKSYDFTSSKKKFFNLRADPYITDHDDFKNRAIAYANMWAAGLINNDVVNKTVSKRSVAPPPPSIKNADRWMAETWSTIKDRTLRQFCMPGSHDAGMGIVTHVQMPDEKPILEIVDDLAKNTVEKVGALGMLFEGAVRNLAPTVAMSMARGMIPRLSVTQTSPIREQLRQGCRFFDLRPAWWGNRFYLAHGGPQSFPRGDGKKDVPLGIIGAIGEPLEEVLKGVASFAKEDGHDKELIVLKFSHHANWDAPNEPINATELFQLIQDTLGSAMIVEPTGHIDVMPLGKILPSSKGPTVLCIYENKLPEGKRQKGYYCYSDKQDSGCDYWLYDEYADSRNPAFIIGDQWWKYRSQMNERGNNNDRVFLLSWTSTLELNPAVMDMRSIIDHAQDLNLRLHTTMKNWIERGDISGLKRPNIIYVDAYDARILDTVTMINALPLSS